MNRKILAGAAVLLLPATSLLAVLPAGATSAPKPAKPTVTSVSVTHTGAASMALSSSQIGWDELATVTITGTGFYGVSDPTGANLAADNTNFVFSNLPQAKSGTTITGGPVKSVTVDPTHTQITLSVQAPGGALQNTAKPGTAGKLSVTLTSGGGTPGFAGGKVTATGPALVSNCGALPTLASAGTTYATDDTGGLTYPLSATGSNAALDYFDVYLFGQTLCTPDVLGTGTSNWASNYALTFTGAASTASGHTLTTSKTNPAYGKGQMTNVGFSFLYSNTGQDLSVYGTTVVYSLPTGTKATGCTADANNPTNVTINSCTVAGTKVTVQTSSVQTYHAPFTVVSPVVDIYGITAKTAGAGAMAITPVSTTSYISLSGACTPGPGGNCLSITFQPRMKGANVTYAPIKADVAAS